MSVNIITWYVNAYLVNKNQQRNTSIKSGTKPRLLHIFQITLMGVDSYCGSPHVFSLVLPDRFSRTQRKFSGKSGLATRDYRSYIIASFYLSLYRYGIQRRNGQVITIVAIIIAIGVYIICARLYYLDRTTDPRTCINFISIL